MKFLLLTSSWKSQPDTVFYVNFDLVETICPVNESSNFWTGSVLTVSGDREIHVMQTPEEIFRRLEAK